MKRISIVIPVFNEPGLSEAVPRLLALTEKLPGFQWEFLFVDDGSRDDSLAVLQSFRERHPRVIRIAKLTRNFGSLGACLAGLSLARGDCVGMLAADLQDPPELFLEMVPHWEKGIGAVFAVRVGRDESFLRKWSAGLYYSMMRKFAVADFPEGGFDCFLLDRRVVDQLNQLGEKNTHLMSLIFWLGHPHVLVPYVRQRRARGVSKWTAARKLKLLIDSLVAFSYLPIRFVSAVGLGFAACAFVYAAMAFVSWAVHGSRVEGWTALMIFIAFTAGVQMTMLGILGEYLWRTLDQTRRRPPYVIDRIFEE